VLRKDSRQKRTKAVRIGELSKFEPNPSIVVSNLGAKVSTSWIPEEELWMKTLARFITNESGATAIEYGLIAALIAVVIITAVTAVGTSLSTTFTTVSGKIK